MTWGNCRPAHGVTDVSFDKFHGYQEKKWDFGQIVLPELY